MWGGCAPGWWFVDAARVSSWSRSKPQRSLNYDNFILRVRGIRKSCRFEAWRNHCRALTRLYSICHWAISPHVIQALEKSVRCQGWLSLQANTGDTRESRARIILTQVVISIQTSATGIEMNAVSWVKCAEAKVKGHQYGEHSSPKWSTLYQETEDPS